MSAVELWKYLTGSAATSHEYLEVCTGACAAARRVMARGGPKVARKAAQLSLERSLRQQKA